MTDSFGARLRDAREQRRITLDAIAHSTKINRALFEGLERDDLSRWPSGIFRRAFIRAYAEAIGLDAEPILAEFVARFPDSTGPAQASSAAPRDRILPVWHDGTAPDPPAPRLTLADEPRLFSWPHVRGLSGSGRAAAAAYDVGIVFALAAVISIVAGRVSIGFAVAAFGYFLGGVLLLGTSPGTRLVERRRKFAVVDNGAPGVRRPPLTGRFVSRRARRAMAQREVHAVEHAAFAARQR